MCVCGGGVRVGGEVAARTHRERDRWADEKQGSVACTLAGVCVVIVKEVWGVVSHQ